MVRHLYRVTDTCIPEEEAVRRLERRRAQRMATLTERGESLFPARIPLPDPACRQAQALLRDRPKG